VHYGNRRILVLAEPATDRFPKPHPPKPSLWDSFNICLPLVPKKKKSTHIFPSGLPTKALQPFFTLRAINVAHLILPYHQNIWLLCKWCSSLLRNFLHPSITSCTLRTIILCTLQSKTLRKCSSLTADTKTHAHTRYETGILQLWSFWTIFRLQVAR